MKNIVIKVCTRAEIEDIVKECKAYIDQNDGRKNLTVFDRYCLYNAKKGYKKYHELLTRFPYAKEFAFNGGQHVNFIIKNL